MCARKFSRLTLKNLLFGSLLKHRFITPINLSIHIHDPLYNGPGIVLGIVAVDAEFTAAVFGVPMKGPYDVMQMVGLHLFDGDIAILGWPCS
jgi:hypothetical protein